MFIEDISENVNDGNKWLSVIDGMTMYRVENGTKIYTEDGAELSKDDETYNKILNQLGE